MDHGKWKRLLVSSLCAVMVVSEVFSITGCKKKTASGEKNSEGAGGSNPSQSNSMAGPTTPDGEKHGDTVLETDTYFSNSEFSVSIPEKEGRTPISTDIFSACFQGQYVAVPYARHYELTKEELEKESEAGYESDEYFDLEERKEEVGAVITTLSGENVGYIDFHGYGIWDIFAAPDGGFGAVIYRLNRDRNTKSMVDFEKKYIVLFNEKGEVQSEFPIDEKCTRMEMTKVLVLPNGKYLYFTHGTICLLDEKGTLLHSVEDENISTVYAIDGKYYAVSFQIGWDVETNAQKTMFHCFEINTDTLELGKEQPLASNVPYEFNLFPDNGDVYSNDGEGICKLNILTGEKERILLWGDTDVYFEEISGIRVVSQEEIFIQERNTWTRLHKEEKNPHAGKRIIFVGVNNIEPLYYKQIAEYNQRPESLARVYVYYPNSDAYIYDLTDKATAADQLLLDMKSGEGPDILINYSEFGQFDNESVLLDLNPYLDGDKGIDRSLYFDNIFRAYEVNGKLFQLPLTVMINGLAVNPKILGDLSGWTYDEYDQKLKALPDGVMPILFESSSGYPEELNGLGILLKYLYSDMSHYVDYNHLEAHFDSDEFRRLLDLARRSDPHITKETFQGIKDSYGEYADNVNFLMLQDGINACTPVYMRGLIDYFTVSGVFQKHPLLLGYPAFEKPGLSAQAHMTVAISAFTQAPDEAWDFVRYYMSSEVQNRIFDVRYGTVGVSTCRESENISIQRELKEMGSMQNSGEVDQDVIDSYLRVIENISHRIVKNPTIAEIIKEEAPAYFDGYKSSEEVSKTIQDRVSTLLSEMK